MYIHYKHKESLVLGVDALIFLIDGIRNQKY